MSQNKCSECRFKNYSPEEMPCVKCIYCVYTRDYFECEYHEEQDDEE